jgi:pSer/pThr/pTyr-binding forkhead associated (FHA) protein
MYCTTCGHKNSEGARFCSRCGAALETAPEETTVTYAIDTDLDDDAAVALDELGPDQALVVIKRGPSAGSNFLLDKDVTTCGRHPESDIFLNDITVSRRHADILREGARFIIKDVGSLNGTYLNRERVDVGELSNGDEIQIGKFKLQFYSAGGASA